MNLAPGTSLTVLSQRALDRARLRPVETLQLWTHKIHDVTRLRAAPHLKKLTLDETSVRDLTPLASAADLETLSLRHNRLTDVSGLRDLPSLRCLFLNHNRIRELRPLLGLRSLVAVDVEGNPADASVLLELPEIHRVDSTFKNRPA